MVIKTLFLLLLAPWNHPHGDAQDVDEVLAQWGHRSSEIRTIKATFTRTDVVRAFDKKMVYQGWYVYRDEKAIRLDFAESVDGRAAQFHERLDGRQR